ncbi:MAG: peptidylprolyl isomerase [Myxococcota bacterium]|nr:peptidylprolyl isomerase [Myxococcota bacterium]
MRGVLASAALCMALANCSETSQPRPASVFRPADVARVGDVAIPRLLVARVAGAQDVGPRRALDALLEDALAAEGARRRELERLPSVVWGTEVALARILSRHIHEEARAQGPPGIEEVAQLRVIHAVVLRSPSLPRARALAAAESLRQAVSRARDEDEFEQSAKASVPVPVTVERLPQFDATGEMQGGELDPVFVSAAFGLHHPGETSPVVETQFGWHVIRLVARRAPDADTAAPRAYAFNEAVIELRARNAMDAVLAAHQRRLTINMSVAADRLMTDALAAVR